jgi:hypothetical protein
VQRSEADERRRRHGGRHVEEILAARDADRHQHADPEDRHRSHLGPRFSLHRPIFRLAGGDQPVAIV